MSSEDTIHSLSGAEFWYLNYGRVEHHIRNLEPISTDLERPAVDMLIKILKMTKKRSG